MPEEKRKLSRRAFSYYMRVMNVVNGQLVGYLADISTGGFKLESDSEITVNEDFQLRIELTNEVANKNSMIFKARSKWCAADPIDPFSFNVGFQITNMSPEDFEIFLRLFEKYGSQKGDQSSKSSTDYLWR